MQLPVNPLGPATLLGAQAASSQIARTGAQVDQAAGQSAVQSRDADVVSLSTREIDDKGASVDDRDADGRTPWQFTPPPADDEEERSAQPQTPSETTGGDAHLDIVV